MARYLRIGTALLLALILALWCGCGKDELESDVGGAAKLAASKAGEADDGDGAGEKPGDEEGETTEVGQPPEDFFWGGDGVGGEDGDTMPDSFGPAGPSPVLLLLGSEVSAWSSEVEIAGGGNPEVRGSLTLALDPAGSLDYERDDDVGAEWVELPVPFLTKEGIETQRFAGMAVWGDVAFAPATPSRGPYEAESAIYLVRDNVDTDEDDGGATYERVVDAYAELVSGGGWRKVAARPAGRVAKSVSWIRVEGPTVHEISIADCSGAGADADVGLVQVTLARVEDGTPGFLHYIESKYRLGSTAEAEAGPSAADEDIPILPRSPEGTPSPGVSAAPPQPGIPRGLGDGLPIDEDPGI